MKNILKITALILAFLLIGCGGETPEVKEPSTEEAKTWLLNEYNNKVFNSDLEIKDELEEYNATFVWKVQTNDYLSSNFELVVPENDEEVKVDVSITVLDPETSLSKTEDVVITFLLKGWSNDFIETIEALNDQMALYKEVSENISLPTELNGNKIVWESSNEKALSSKGKVVLGENDVEVELSATITINQNKKTLVYKVLVKKAEHTFSEVEAWLLDKYDGIEVNGNIELPTKLEEFGAELLWEIGEFEYLDEEGNFTAPILDTETDVFVFVTMNGREQEVMLMFTLKGWGKEIDVIKDWAEKQVPTEISTSFRFPQSHNYYESTLVWESSNPEVLSADGMVTKDNDKDVKVTLTCNITYLEEKATLTFDVVVLKKTDAEKNFEVREWLDGIFGSIETIDKDLDLPTVFEKYNAKISWQTSSPGVISETGKYNKPLFDRVVEIMATSVIGKHTLKVNYKFNAYGEPAKDVWESVNMLLSFITHERITNQKYYTFGFQENYKENPVQNVGYLPFYVSENADVSVEILEVTHGRNRTGIKKTSTEYIVIHDTGSAAPGATARSHANWLESMTNGDAEDASWVSWHYTIDENETIQHVPLDEVAYHAGDGSTTYPNTWSGGLGGGNRNGIGIETCVNLGSDYNVTMRRTAKLVAELLIDFNLGLDRVKQHYDFSGKDCPMTMRHAQRWEEFMSLIEIEYFAKTRLNGVIFKWTSLNPEIMDDTGKIINHPGNEAVVKYKVDVTYQGETKTFEFSSILNELEK